MTGFLSRWRELFQAGFPPAKRGLHRFGRPAEARRRLWVEALEGRVLLSHGPTDHIHPKLSIVIEGQPVTVPANIGITSDRHYSPHTHDANGELHVGEAPISGIDPPTAQPRLTTLKDFFDVWRTTGAGTPANNPNAVFSQDQIMDRRAGPTGVIRMTVNGQPNTQFENYSPHDQDQVIITFERVAPPARPGAFQFSVAAYTVAANVGSTIITVTRANGSDGAVQVNYATSDGTGRVGVDYQTASGELRFAAGETTKTFTVSILNANAADTKTVNLTLSNPQGGATLGTPATATLNITSVRPPTDPVANQAYVVQAYRDLLKREADADGLRNWTAVLNNGGSTGEVLLGLTSTQEFYEKTVRNMYAGLPRPPGRPGGVERVHGGVASRQHRGAGQGRDLRVGRVLPEIRLQQRRLRGEPLPPRAGPRDRPGGPGRPVATAGEPDRPRHRRPDGPSEPGIPRKADAGAVQGVLQPRRGPGGHGLLARGAPRRHARTARPGRLPGLPGVRRQVSTAVELIVLQKPVAGGAKT